MKYIPIVTAIAVIGLLFLIFNNIITTYNYKKRAIYNLIFGLVLTLIFATSYILDYFVFKKVLDKIIYFSFILVSVFYTSFLCSKYFRKGKMLRQNISGRVKTVLDKKEYLYIVYAHENEVYLEKEKHHGIVYKMDNRDFHDEVIKKLNNKYNVSCFEENIEKIGEYTIKDKKDIIYHCYYIGINDKMVNDEYVSFDKKDVIRLDFEHIDRQIIFRILLREFFDVVVEKNN